jgi:recombination protein RecA
MVCLDSVAQLSTRHELEVGLAKSDMTKAKQLRSGIRQSVKFLSSNNVTYLISNHTIAAIGDMWNPKTTPGGKAIPFQCAVRLELDLGKKLFDDNDQPEGVISRVYCKKNKVSIPFRNCTLQIDFKRGLTRTSGLLDMLEKFGLVELKGAWYNYKDIKFQRGDFDKHYEKILGDIKGEVAPKK